ncbi:filamentous hemagglutinin N-terminal domain-containing protein [Leptothoe sp. LEGE 181152]|nr:filamentous hemagglutinin N-terminal domain-containing protein [Leptothoe sp. LEGE 181152]
MTLVSARDFSRYLIGQSRCFSKWISLSVSILLQGVVFSSATAQVIPIPDDTLGAEMSRIVNIGGSTFQISGGATRDSNLFHSFSEFSIGNGDAVYFGVDSDAISNIVARVTGNSLSDIQGILGTCNLGNCPNNGTDATLYLMNPNGIMFGPNAELDVGGSFVATTANEIEFGEQGIFSATKPLIPSQQLVIDPSALLFNQLNTSQPLNSIESRATLTLPEQRSLVLVGGNINPTETATGNIVIREGRLRAPGGNIEIGGITNVGRVGLTTDKTAISISQPENISRIDFTMTGEVNGFADLDVTSGNGGSINIYANNINILGGSDICAGIGSTPSCGSQATDFGTIQSQAGDIVFDALETVRIADPISIVENDVNPNATGNSGNIIIIAESLILKNGGQLSTSTYGNGNTGKIIANITDNFSMSQLEEDIDTRINSNVLGIGNSGGVSLNANNVILENGAQIQSEVVGEGDSGNIEIQASESVKLTGNIPIAGSIGFIPSALRTDVIGEGNGGDITINTGSLDLLNRAQILTQTEGKGDAGNIAISTREDITLVDSDLISEISKRDVPIDFTDTVPVNGGNITLTARSLFLFDGSSVLADNEYYGTAGHIQITITDNLILRGQSPANLNPNVITPSQISSGIDAGGFGAGGTIEIESHSLLLEDGGFISTSTSGFGNAGNLRVQSDTVELQNESSLSTRVRSGGFGFGGTLDVRSDDIQIQNGGSITTGIEAGSIGIGGSLNVETGELFLAEGGFISTVTAGFGNAGDLTLRSNNIQLQNGGYITTSTFGVGNSGKLTIHASDILLNGASSENGGSSFIEAAVDSQAFGNGGELLVNTNHLTIKDGARIRTTSFGRGNAGNLRIQASDSVELIGTDTEGLIKSNINAITESSGRGGNLILESDQLIIKDGAGIAVASFGEGDAGRLEVYTTGDILISGASPDDSLPSGINSSSNFASGDATGGEVVISGRNLSLLDGGRVISRSNSFGDAGSINITLSEVLRMTNGEIASDSQQSSGGDITIGARSAILRDDGDIRTNSFGVDGGDITLNIPVIVLLDDSDILAFAPDGQGGNITFNSLALLTDPLYQGEQQQLQNREELERLDGNETVDINASGVVSGQILGVPEITFLQNSLTDLPTELSSSERLLANSCIARAERTGGSFIIAGGDNLPVRPDNDDGTIYSTGDVTSIGPDTSIESSNFSEPQSIYQLADGRIVMSRECDS